MTTRATKTTLSATLGAGCVGLLCQYLPAFEGVILHGYRDPIGIVTACAGHTKTAKLSMRYTPEKCEELLIEDIADHAGPTLSCVAGGVRETLTTGQKAAIISFSFNVGVSAFCGSTMARRLNAGDPEWCAELSRWTRAGGRELPGLVKRRATERAMCEGRIG